MPDTTLEELLERNARHTDSLSPEHFARVRDQQSPAVVSVCCSDSRVSQEGMWDVREPGWLFTPSTIGNQVWDDVAGEQVVAGSVLYPMLHTETRITVVVGHTGCGAITAALAAVREGRPDLPPGLQTQIDSLVPVVEAGLADDRVAPDRKPSVIDQLVEHNVDAQVNFLVDRPEIPDEERIFGFVYDFQGVYGVVDGRAYLVNADGETDLDHLVSIVPEHLSGHVARLL